MPKKKLTLPPGSWIGVPKGSVPPTPRVWKDPRALTAAAISSLLGGEDALERYAYEPETLTPARRRQLTKFLERHGQIVLEMAINHARRHGKIPID